MVFEWPHIEIEKEISQVSHCGRPVFITFKVQYTQMFLHELDYQVFCHGHVLDYEKAGLKAVWLYSL